MTCPVELIPNHPDGRRALAAVRPPRGRRRSAGRFGPAGRMSRRELQAVEAEAAARAAVRETFGLEVAARSRWRGEPDGTAIGVVEGLDYRWVPESETDGGGLHLLRRCRACGDTWPAPVRSGSVGELIGAVVEYRCGCPHVRRASGHHGQVGA